MPLKPADRYPRYRAPAKNGQIFCQPSWSKLNDLVVNNREHLTETSPKIFGQSLRQLAEEARSTTLQAALTYTRSYADVDDPISCTSPLIVTGHQPELVHAGVWLKNFAAAQLASQTGGIAINLIIDNDLCRSPSIRIPTGNLKNPHLETVNYDRPIEEQPYEERRITDSTLWNSFGKRAADTLKPLLDEPSIANWWQEAVLSQDASHLGTAIAQGRHRTELAWGSKSLELPQSRICQTASFRWFAVQMLANATKVLSAYNDALAEYRRVHRLRNHAQPIPDLIEAEDWIETPFWIWSADNPQRRALFVQNQKNELLLSDHQGYSASLPIPSELEPAAAIEQLATWEGQGVKLRTRALFTTMYARLFLADLFIHGIGGAKYDQVTDAICRRLFGFEPPPYATLSGTLLLPIDHQTFSVESQLELKKELREIIYHPEIESQKLSLDKHSQSEIDALQNRKMDWVHTAQTLENASERHQNITKVNHALQHWLMPRRTVIENQLAESEHLIRANKLLESREYPFCLFSRESLHKFLLDFSRRMP